MEKYLIKSYIEVKMRPPNTDPVTHLCVDI